MKQNFKFIFSFSRLIGICLISLSIVLTIIFGFSINNTLTFLLGTTLFLIGKRISKSSLILKKIILFFILLGSSILIFFLTIMISHGQKNDTTYKEKIVLVLGSGIDGTVPTPMLKERLEKALNYYHKNPKAMIIVSGGQGKGEDIPEAKAMATYLIQGGVPEALIFEENKSKNTLENIFFSKKIIEKIAPQKQDIKVVIITTDFHTFRAKSIAKDYGIEISTLSAPIPFYLRIGTYLREIISITKYFAIDKQKKAVLK